MNVLFSAGLLGKTPITNNIIEIILAETLATEGHRCIVTGRACDTTQNRITREGVQILYLATNTKLAEGMKKFENHMEFSSAANRFNFCLRHPVSAVQVYLMQKGRFQKNPVKTYTKQIQHLCFNNKIDAVICFNYPFEYAEAVMEQDLGDTVKMYYQLDPYGLHALLPDEEKDARIQREIRVMQNADCVFTTPILYETYTNHPRYRSCLEKMNIAEFPVFSKPDFTGNSVLNFDKNKTSFVFCGSIHNSWRNPDYILRIFESIFLEDKSVCLYFIGSNQGGLLSDFVRKYPNNIFVHGMISNEDSLRVMKNADFLLNIENTISNMIPSKIFSYFATGRPIINIQKIADSPAVPYFERYPLQLTLREYEGEDASRLKDFIKKNKGRQIQYEDIQSLYDKATPQYVSSSILKAIRTVSNQRRTQII